MGWEKSSVGFRNGRGGGGFGGTRSGYFANNVDGFNNQQQQQIFADFDDGMPTKKFAHDVTILTISYFPSS